MIDAELGKLLKSLVSPVGIDAVNAMVSCTAPRASRHTSVPSIGLIA
jgi:hypothetical protein